MVKPTPVSVAVLRSWCARKSMCQLPASPGLSRSYDALCGQVPVPVEEPLAIDEPILATERCRLPPRPPRARGSLARGARPLSWLEPKLRFEINRSAAERIGLRIGAKILKMGVDTSEQSEATVACVYNASAPLGRAWQTP
jgi:hypothetical protein